MTRSLLLAFAAFCLLSSCATVKPIDNAQPILAAKELEGRYGNAAKNFPEHSYHNLKSIVDFKDKSGIADVASVEIKVVDDDELEFLFEDNRGNSARYRCGYRLEDGKVLLKNKNFRLTGIPYLLGGYKINKTVLAKNSRGDLLLSAVQADEGAILFIIPASTPKSHFQNIYPKR